MIYTSLRKKKHPPLYTEPCLEKKKGAKGSMTSLGDGWYSVTRDL